MLNALRLWSARTTVLGTLLLAMSAGCENQPVRLGGTPPLVTASGALDTEKGSLEIAVSPQDADGNFVGYGLDASAFAFRNVTMTSASGDEIALPTSVSGIDVHGRNVGAALDVVVIFDSSGSMRTNDPGMIGRERAGLALFELLDEFDQAAVLDFGPSPTAGLEASRLLQDFTSDRDALAASLGRLRNSGGTPLYASILDGLALLEERSREANPVLVVLTDGRASDDSRASLAIQRAMAQRVPVYAVGLGMSLDFSDLHHLGSETGGGFTEATEAMALEDAFTGITTGFRVGSVVVRGESLFPRGTVQVGEGYTVEGELVTDDGFAEYVTPFSFTTTIESPRRT